MRMAIVGIIRTKVLHVQPFASKMEPTRRDSRASSFTHNGLLFALLSIDGRLRIWDVVSGKVVQEFSPASTIESSCTCLCWTRNRNPKEKKKKVSSILNVFDVSIKLPLRTISC